MRSMKRAISATSSIKTCCESVSIVGELGDRSIIELEALALGTSSAATYQSIVERHFGGACLHKTQRSFVSTEFGIGLVAKRFAFVQASKDSLCSRKYRAPGGDVFGSLAKWAFALVACIPRQTGVQNQQRHRC